MNLLKRLFRVFEAKATTLAVNSIKPLENYNLAAVAVMDQIERLSRQKNANMLVIKECKEESKRHKEEADHREIQVKALMGKGEQIERAVVVLILRKRQLADGLAHKADKLEESNDRINEAIVNYGNKLDSLKAQLELLRLEESFKKEGIAMPQDIDFDVEEVNISVDRLMQEVDVFTGAGVQSNVTALDVESYLASLQQKA